MIEDDYNNFGLIDVIHARNEVSIENLLFDGLCRGKGINQGCQE